ncbi:Ketosamine-3-kinase [Hypsizygus marmoreus]|uniref:protein-ribulosamine 3-kinase n=1 Tax=Hypsizygus marmoreus TaxID=39966 RepID=A0A369K590_HYPMA|nr:Ketosamine-3-kinase [Hypsizygus marmoreus]
MIRREIPRVLLEHLQAIEPGAKFTGNLPKIRSSSGNLYFVKSGSPVEKEQYNGEVESLKAIEAAAPGLAPHVLSYGTDSGDKPYFISEYKDLGRITDSTGKVLATRLAEELHVYQSAYGFGFHVPTYCGATRLRNGWFKSWEECFGAMIGDLLDQLAMKRSYGELCDLGQRVRKSVIPELLGPLNIRPVLLHGDLWSGNVGVDLSTKQPIIFDPASFFGHNEADLAIARIFGGFPSSFFTTYHALHPKSDPVDQYTLRGDLYELFHYLNHTLLFGGSYADSARRKMVRLLEAKRVEE